MRKKKMLSIKVRPEMLEQLDAMRRDRHGPYFDRPRTWLIEQAIEHFYGLDMSNGPAGDASGARVEGFTPLGVG